MTDFLPSKAALETALQHRSIRRYLKKPLECSTKEAILAAVQAASSSSFMQCVSVIRVTDDNTRQALMTLAAGQKYVAQAPEFWVFCADYTRHHAVCSHAQTDWIEALLIGAVDVGIAAQNALLVAESLGVGGVFIGSIRNNSQAVAELLSLPKDVAPLLGLCLGYPDQNPTLRPRLPSCAVVFENVHQAPDLPTLASYDKVMEEYYLHRSGLNLNWSQSVHNVFGKALRPDMLDFLHVQGFAKR